MSSAGENKRIVQDAYEAIAKGDVRAFFAALDPQIEVHEPDPLPHGGVHKGFDELQAMFGKAMTVLAPGKLDVLELTADEDRVVALLRLGLKDGSDALVAEHWRLRDGKATELRVFWADPTVVRAAA